MEWLTNLLKESKPVSDAICKKHGEVIKIRLGLDAASDRHHWFCPVCFCEFLETNFPVEDKK